MKSKKVFKEPIELPGQAAGPILDATEVKEIFGNLPPIYETHCTIKDRLERLTNRMHNDESVSVGEIYLDNVNDNEYLLSNYEYIIDHIDVYLKGRRTFENLSALLELLREDQRGDNRVRSQQTAFSRLPKNSTEPTRVWSTNPH